MGRFGKVNEDKKKIEEFLVNLEKRMIKPEGIETIKEIDYK